MRKDKKTFTREFEERKQEFMDRFSDEAPMVRSSLVDDLPAHNVLLSIHAESFGEIILRHLAEQQGIPYDPEKPPSPECPHCNRSDCVGRKEEYMFRCRRCDKTFSVNHDSIAAGTKCDALTWMKVLQCLLNNVSMTKTCEYCDIYENTYYNIRSRLFYAMSILLQKVRLYGNIEVDNTFVRVSYKGVNLRESEFPEDSIFFDSSFKPRSARQRGGAIPVGMKNANHICIFTGIDDRGHVLARFIGVGNASYLSLKHYISPEFFLAQVPKNDPFAWRKRQRKEKKNKETVTKAGQNSVMIADKEGSIRRFAQSLDVEFESHVYRKDGVHRKLAKGSHNIQRVNALHRRLKEFLQNHGYISSKYLPGYLTLFEFIENTGASQEAIAELFRIIACPGFGKPPSFFKELFMVPNYLVEWLHSEHPLKKLPYNKLLAFYLYDIMKHPELYPDERVTMAQIEEETEYTAPTVRKLYRELNDAGYRDLIVKHFSPTQKKESKGSKEKKGPFAPGTLNPTILAIYDAYFEVRKLPRWQQPTLEEFIEQKNKEYGTHYKRTNLLAKFKYIQSKGIREPFQQIKTDGPSDFAFELLRAYEEMKSNYREKGEEPPDNTQMFLVLSERYNRSVSIIQHHVSTARAYLLRQKEQNADLKQE